LKKLEVDTVPAKFDAFMITDTQSYFGFLRSLDTDNHDILSGMSSTKFSITALDVLHSFTILSTGVKVDAIVGRVNDMSTFFLREGVFYGQCSELCGTGHFGMPIVSEVLDPFFYNGFFEYFY
jgi:cytochrome c oxidase subunit 2